MKIENINLGSDLFYRSIDLEEINLLKELSHLPQDDVLQILEHLNSLFMNVIVNPELTIFHHSDLKQKEIMVSVHSVNFDLRNITQNIRISKSYWRNIRLNKLV